MIQWKVAHDIRKENVLVILDISQEVQSNLNHIWSANLKKCLPMFKTDRSYIFLVSLLSWRSVVTCFQKSHQIWTPLFYDAPTNNFRVDSFHETEAWICLIQSLNIYNNISVTVKFIAREPVDGVSCFHNKIKDCFYCTLSSNSLSILNCVIEDDENCSQLPPRCLNDIPLPLATVSLGFMQGSGLWNSLASMVNSTSNIYFL